MWDKKNRGGGVEILNIELIRYIEYRTNLIFNAKQLLRRLRPHKLRPLFSGTRKWNKLQTMCFGSKQKTRRTHQSQARGPSQVTRTYATVWPNHEGIDSFEYLKLGRLGSCGVDRNIRDSPTASRNTDQMFLLIWVLGRTRQFCFHPIELGTLFPINNRPILHRCPESSHLSDMRALSLSLYQFKDVTWK